MKTSMQIAQFILEINDPNIVLNTVKSIYDETSSRQDNIKDIAKILNLSDKVAESLLDEILEEIELRKKDQTVTNFYHLIEVANLGKGTDEITKIISTAIDFCKNNPPINSTDFLFMFSNVFDILNLNEYISIVTNSEEQKEDN